jgi:acetoin utilization deacetylase AcuC-like enzyme
MKLCLFYPEGHAAHAEYGHVERPERVEVIRKTLTRVGLWGDSRQVTAVAIEQPVLEAVHSSDYLSLLERACRRGGHLDADTYVTNASWQLALQAAGGAAAVAQEVWHRQVDTGLALCRPPGHHAMRGQGMGFCLMNNIAVAAEQLIQQESAQRLAIVDLDLHHGNGTQDVFWERRDVLFISTHQRPLYPGSGSLQERGRGGGEGYTANFPMPPGSGDTAFRAVMEQAILPLLERFAPEMILVSYGFDIHWREPLGHLLVTAGGYANLIASLLKFAQQHCQGRMALVLEGGYDLEAAAACTLGVVNALIEQPWQDPLGAAPYEETEQWQDMLRQAKTIWGL